MTISDVHKRYYGRTIIVDSDITIGGYVTSSDKAGNFYRTFTIGDAGGGAEIMAGLDDLHNIYPEGCFVCIRLRGCAVGESMGVMRIGLPAESYDWYDVDYFYSRVNLDKYIARGDVASKLPVRTVTIDELSVEMCGLPVCIENLVCADEEVDTVWDGYKAFEDSDGRRIYTYTGRYADFADRTVPSSAVAITGILQYGRINREDSFILKMRDHEDCFVYAASAACGRMYGYEPRVREYLD